MHTTPVNPAPRNAETETENAPAPGTAATAEVDIATTTAGLAPPPRRRPTTRQPDRHASGKHRAPRLIRVGRRRRGTATLATLVTALAVTGATAAGCTTDNNILGGATTSSSNNNSGGGGATTSPPVTLGEIGQPTPDEVGAPYDPCDVVSWDDIPATARPDNPDTHFPKPVNPDKKDPDFAIGCSWRNDEDIVIGGTGQPPADPQVFIVWVTWGGDDITTADPTKIDNAEAATYGDTPGAILEPTPTADLDPACAGWADLTTGIANVIVINSRFPDVDACDLVTTLLTTITTEHG